MQDPTAIFIQDIIIVQAELDGSYRFIFKNRTFVISKIIENNFN